MSKAKTEPSKAVSLAAYAAAKKAAAIRCTVCKLAQRADIEGDRASSGASFFVISQWLREEHGVMIGEGAIAQHFRQGHHEKAIAR